MDALKNRVRLFMEGIMTMVCPVLLAMVLNEQQVINQKTTEGRLELVANGITTSIAALTLQAGISPFVFLCLPERAARYLYGASKWIVHLGALLLVALAVILLLIGMGKPVYMLVVVALAVVPTMELRPLVTACAKQYNTNNTDDRRDYLTIYAEHEVMLENLVDFSAAVTAILFLGLEGMALSGQTTISTGKTAAAHALDGRLLRASFGVGFCTCVIGVFVMLLGTVPPNIEDGDKGAIGVEIANIVLAIFTAATVTLISCAAMKEVGWYVIVPALVAALTWGYLFLFGGPGDGEVQVAKPASLQLMKVTFTGFFAVSVLSVSGSSSSSLGSYTKAFIMLTAAAVISGIVWRLLTHRTISSTAVAIAANTASVCAHVCVAIAVYPFAIMALEGVTK